MESLILIAHGSRVERSNAEIRRLSRRLQHRANGRYCSIRYAFLEMGEPDLVQAVRQCLDDGAQHVTVLPYFLAPGRHVCEDIPRQVQSIQDALTADHPHLSIAITAYFGAADDIESLLLQHADLTAPRHTTETFEAKSRYNTG